jgi:hypothetical protein
MLKRRTASAGFFSQIWDNKNIHYVLKVLHKYMSHFAEPQTEWILNNILVNGGWIIDNLPKKNVYCPKFGRKTPHLQCVVSTYKMGGCNIIRKPVIQFTTVHIT